MLSSLYQTIEARLQQQRPLTQLLGRLDLLLAQAPDPAEAADSRPGPVVRSCIWHRTSCSQKRHWHGSDMGIVFAATWAQGSHMGTGVGGQRSRRCGASLQASIAWHADSVEHCRQPFFGSL